MLISALQAPNLDVINKLHFNYVDGIVVAWLIIGLFRGRKLGMSQELLPLLMWLTILIVASQFYLPFSKIIRENTSFEPLWANLTAYIVIALVIRGIFGWLKKAFGEKLVGSDVFGGSEYYFGMISGMVRFLCMLIALCAIMNARLYTDKELADEAKAQKQSFEDVSFPTYPKIQHSVLAESFSGQLIKKSLSSLLIYPVGAEKKKDTLAKKQNAAIDEVLGSPGAPQKK